MRRKRFFVRGACALLAIECVLVASYATAATPLPVPVDGISHAAVARIEEQPRGGKVAFAPIDPLLVIGPRPAPVAKRLEALATSLPEHR